MLAQTLAVIGGQYDEGVVVELSLFELRQELSDDRVRRGDLRFVGATVASLEESRGRVRRVRLVEVEEEKEGPVAEGVDPCECARRRLVARPLGRAKARCGAAGDALFEVVVVEVEAVIETSMTDQREARDCCASGIAGLSEQPGQVGNAFGFEGVAEVVADAVGVRRNTRKEARMGGKSQRNRRVGALEEDTLFGEPIEGRGRDTIVSVGREVVGAQSVDREDDDRMWSNGAEPRAFAVGRSRPTAAQR